MDNFDLRKYLKEQKEEDSNRIAKAELILPRGKKVYLQAEEQDYQRGLIVELTQEGGYKINYWYGPAASVYPAEVENILYQLDEIAELAVIGIPDKKWGETGKLFVVLKENRELPKEKIIEHCINNLAKFKIPSEIAYVKALPRNATGKVLKRNLKEIRDEHV